MEGKRKKRITGILVIILAALLCAAGGIMYYSSQKAAEAARAEAKALEEKEKEKKLSEEQERLEAEALKAKEEKEDLEEELDNTENEDSKEETVDSQMDKESDTGLEGEAMIHRPQNSDSGEEGLEDLKMQLESMLSSYEGDWAVYVSDLTLGEYLEINSHAVKAASLIKLYIMGAVLEQIEAGNLADDGTIDTLLTNMITISDNESSNELVRRLSPDGTNHEEGMKVVNAFAQKYGYADTSQGRDLRDFREVPAEGENYTSVKDCGLFLERVYKGECVSAEASSKMLELLKQQQRTWKIPAGVPEGVITANKTGELSDTENDTAIVFSDATDYVLCVTATNLTNTGNAQQNIVNISSTVYQYMNQ